MDCASLVIGALGGLLVTMAFATVRTKWPAQYVYPRSPAEQFPMRSLPKYLLFRLLPPYVGACLVAATLSRRGDSMAEGLVVFIIVHAGMTNLTAAAKMLWHDASQPGSLRTSVYHLVSVGLVAVVAVVAFATFRPLLPFVPDPEGLVINLWSAAFTAIAVVAAQNAFSKGRPGESVALQARTVVGESLWAYADEQAAAHSTDPQVMQAIVSAEAIERPAWVRRVETIKGLLGAAGTYGIAQMPCDRPVSDRESIELLCGSFDGFQPERDQHGHILQERLAARVELHNSNSAFVELVLRIHAELTPHARASSDAKYADGRPVIEVTGINRIGQSIVLSGTAAEPRGRLRARVPHRDDAVSIAVGHGGTRRGDWRFYVPLEVHSLIIEPETRGGHEVAEDMIVEVDLTYLS